MARGSIAKTEITKKLLDTFNGSFLYNDGKEIRIPYTEEGELLQIKVTLTCAKENVNQGDDNALPGTVETGATAAPFEPIAKKEEKIVEPTEEEKQNVSDLLRALGL